MQFSFCLFVLLVSENGENWSVGQRQLICLGRAFLKKSSILIIDEATASVDSVTDAMVQKRITMDFNHCTLVIITHRLHTAIDTDFILILNDGKFYNLYIHIHIHILTAI